MENILKYYEFSDFLSDTSGVFNNNSICYTQLNDTHFLIFEKQNTNYNLYISKYKVIKDIGKTPPEGLQLLAEDYNKSNPAHRLLLKKYLY
jgi:hypothetical protein